MEVVSGSFSWDRRKEAENIQKHGVDFKTASLIFKDPRLIVLMDKAHSLEEERFWGIGSVRGRILTVRFVCRQDKIRILGG